MSQTNVKRDHESDSEEEQNDVLPLSLLFKFIRPFNGDRRELNTFIQNCNSAFQMAMPFQTDRLFLYVAAQLSSNVVNEIDLQEISSWTDLKKKLKTYYSQIKDVTQLHEELETIKQSMNESVTDFYKRLEKLKNECISAEQNQCENPNEIPSLKKSIHRTALRRFVLHCRPEISQMLRARDIKTLNEAFSIALQEEKILSYTRIQKHKPNLFCSYCRSNTHSTQHCRKKPLNPPRLFQNSNHQSNDSNNQNNNSASSSGYDPNKFCFYCKNKGHMINECRKRQYRNQFQNSNSTRVNHLNELPSLETSALPEDSQIQEAFNTQ